MIYLNKLKGNNVSVVNSVEDTVNNLFEQQREHVRQVASELGDMYQQELIQLVQDYQQEPRGLKSRDAQQANANRSFCKQVRDLGQNTFWSYFGNATNSWIDWGSSQLGYIPLVGPYAEDGIIIVRNFAEALVGIIRDGIEDKVTDIVIDSLPDSIFNRGAIDPNKVQEAVEALDAWLRAHDGAFRNGCAPGYRGPLFY